MVLLSGVFRRLSSSVTRHGGHAGSFTSLQSNYSPTVTLHGGLVVVRPDRATPCLKKYLLPLTDPCDAVPHAHRLVLRCIHITVINW